MRMLVAPVLVATTVLLVGCGGDTPTPTPGRPGANGAPAAPMNVTATPGPGYVIVQWQDHSDDETGFAIYRQDVTATITSTQQAPTRIGEVGANVTEFVDDDVKPDRSFTYEVTAENEESESIPAGLASGDPTMLEALASLMVGPANLGEDGPWTAFLLHFFFADVPGQATVTVHGPPGWHDDDPWTYTPSSDDLATGWTAVYAETPPVEGVYELEVALGPEVHADEATLEDATTSLPHVEDLTVERATSNELSSSWSRPAGATSFVASLIDSDGEVRARRVTGEDRVTFANPPLQAGSYRLVVWAFPVNLATIPLARDGYAASRTVSDAFELDGVEPHDCEDPAAVIDVPDSALREAIRTTLEGSQDPTCAEMASLFELDVEDAGVRDLTGLEYAVNLRELRAHRNEIDDLSPLEGLTSLSYLGLDDNEVADLGPLSKLTELSVLTFISNHVSDVSPLAGLARLEILAAIDNDISDVSSLNGLTALERLYVSDNPIGDIAVVEGLDDLTALGAARIGLRDLGPVTGTELTYLWINGNEDLDDFTPLSDMTSLEELLAGHTGFGDDEMVMLADKTSLRRLQLFGNEDVTDLSVLESLPQLDLEVDVGGSGVRDLSPIHGHSDLERLSIYGLGLEDEDVDFLTGFEELVELRLDWNDLTSLAPLVANPGLGDGDTVNLRENLLDLEYTPVLDDIATLEARGVELEIEPQRPGARCLGAVKNQMGETHAVDPKGTYLTPHPEDEDVTSPTKVGLADLGIEPGDCLGLHATGAYQAAGDFEDDSSWMTAVFAGEAGFIVAEHGEPTESEVCLGDERASNDIPEDFRVLEDLVAVEVPAGAQELQVGPFDCYFSDNSDPNGDFGVVLYYR